MHQVIELIRSFTVKKLTLQQHLPGQILEGQQSGMDADLGGVGLHHLQEALAGPWLLGLLGLPA